MEFFHFICVFSPGFSIYPLWNEPAARGPRGRCPDRFCFMEFFPGPVRPVFRAPFSHKGASRRSGLDNHAKIWYNIIRKGGKGTLEDLSAVRTRRVAFICLRGSRQKDRPLTKIKNCVIIKGGIYMYKKIIPYKIAWSGPPHDPTE